MGGASGSRSKGRGCPSCAPPRGSAPSPPPLPMRRPRSPPRAHTLEPWRHANEVPERRGSGRGKGSGGREGLEPRAPGAHPPTPAPAPALAAACARRPRAPRSRPGRALAQTPFLAAPAVRGPAPLIGRRPHRARLTRSGAAGRASASVRAEGEGRSAAPETLVVVQVLPPE